MAAVGFAGGLYRFEPGRLAGLPQRMAIALAAPALGEEIVFRGLLVPDREEIGSPRTAFAVSTVAFIAWHVFEAFVVLPRARSLFLRPDFLTCAAVLGLGCAILRWRSGSLWPAIMLHWLVVIVWQTWLGGPTLEALR